MKEFIALATIECYDEEEDLQTDNIVLTEVENFTDAVGRIEKYYGYELHSIVSLQLYAKTFLTLDNTSFDLLKEDLSNQ